MSVNNSKGTARFAGGLSAAAAVDMGVNLGGIAMKNPLNTASGTFGTAAQFEAFMDVSQLGAVTTKGCSAKPWEGNAPARLCETPSGLMNSVGLQNPGIARFVELWGTYFSGLAAKGCQVIFQICGHTLAEYVEALEMANELCTFAAGFEINISCPNIDAGGAAFGATPQAAAEVVHALRAYTTRPLLVKMAPVNVAETARALEAQGADALSLINTIPAMAINVHTRKSKLSRPQAGLSGPAIHPIAVRMVWEAAQATSLPICAMGGVASATDAAEFILAGATAVSVGTAQFAHPTLALQVLEGLQNWAREQGVSKISDLKGAFIC